MFKPLCYSLIACMIPPMIEQVCGGCPNHHYFTYINEELA